MNSKKPNVCIDFDGVLNTYNGWQGENELFDVRVGCREFLEKLHEIYHVIIFTTRDINIVTKWLKNNDLSEFIYSVTNEKPIALVYVDDGGINFSGDFDETYKNILKFKPYWK